MQKKVRSTFVGPNQSLTDIIDLNKILRR